MSVLLAMGLAASIAVNGARVTPAPAGLPLGPEARALLTSPFRHVRALCPRLARVLELGLFRSPTFARLVADLDRTDVIVQIVASQNLRPSLAGRIVLVPNPRAVRYLRVQIRAEGRDEDLAALIAHELRHALEIAAATWVRDDDGLIELYRKIGESLDSDRHQYDTADARDTGRQVRREIAR
jgi:hypothetical protein